ncbi:coiled-coil alpha-helical rod protein 1 isoform X1 [Sinocyclocheilus anshuiensis]|uniref:Coiled-coil alpha-helical rod protein 1 n=2 Tax=Sinocyclocheilus anshuiensis TaxID=1608454 RepID=A0A671MR64_9TELE|nr:PREDICTED: coiled-coil alpha-helical rod protein 1-like isoform X1 [Sinocyclocheilus anshuiensis]
MDMWKAEKLNAPADFMKAPDDGASVCNPTPPLMTPAQFTGGPLARPTASQTTPTQTLPSLFRAPPPSKFTEEGFGWTEPAAVEAWRPVHHKNQSEKILHHHSDHRLPEDERSSSKPLLQEMERLREDKKIMRGEMERLEGRVECLREQIRDQQNQINRQCIESDELHSELKSCKAELGMSQDQLSTLKREYELQRQHLEKELQDSKQEMRRLQQKLETQNVMTGAAQEVTLLRTQIQEVISERDELKNQLSVLNSSLLEQSECVQKLRTYIGSNITEKKEEELRRQIQHLEKEKEALSLSVQLLNVRVNAANDILAIQEKELGEQVQTDPLYSGSKAGQMLSVWRQKVFMLLVKLQTRDLELHMEKTQLHNMVSSQQQQVECLQSQNSVFQHQLEDKTAQLELQHVHAQGVQQQLDSALQENAQLKECNKSTEGSLNDISETAHRVMSAVEMKAGQMEAAQSSVSQLNQRLAFAAKRLDTVHGLLLRKEALWRTKKATRSPEPALSESFIKSLQAEVVLLSAERDKLTQELKRTPELIQASLSELQQQRARELGHLRKALSQSRAELEASESSRMEMQRQCEEHEGTIVELRAENQRLQQQCDSVLQKVSVAETVCEEKLRDMEAQLNTARREHTKAVVVLRQVQRQVEREKDQMKAVEKERTEHTHKRTTHLQKQLKDKDKDRNLLLAVVQEQGLMNEYKILRRSAIQTTEALKQKHPPQSESSNPSTPESLLGALQALSAAVMGSSEEEDDDEEGQAFTVTQTPSCADTHKE